MNSLASEKTISLLRVSNHINDELKNKKSTGMLIFDVEKAFDGVWHNGLLHKMFQFKIPLYIIKMVQSFLKERSFHVSIKDVRSEKLNIPAGVPQGSVLSPILYNIFTSDLKLPQKTCKISLFADDTALFTSSKNPDKIQQNLETASKLLYEYCNQWKIKLNTLKTQAAYFTKRRSSRWLPQNPLTINNNPIPWNSEAKYLGVILDKSLTFKRHTGHAVERAQKYIKILNPLINRKSQLSKANKILLYKSVLQSLLLYGCPVWGRCARSHINKLQLIQNRCLKIIMNLPRHFSTRKLHLITKVQTIPDQIEKINKKFKRKLHYSKNILIHQLQL